MNHHILPTEGIEEQSCSVVCVSQLFSIPYTEAYLKLKALGRLEAYGVDFPDLAFKLGLTPMPDLAGKTLARVMLSLGSGRFAIRIRGHVFTVVDGVIYDCTEQRGNTKVLMVYQYEQTNRPKV